ncbi:hypothetical protein O3P69_020370 [Scylla paramamosain]|uniref:Uncharacterized protein n=1 Tax=Scylla paramamosain TaxID=85552 RepID=A0AAW0TKT4_SCYPA
MAKGRNSSVAGASDARFSSEGEVGHCCWLTHSLPHRHDEGAGKTQLQVEGKAQLSPAGVGMSSNQEAEQEVSCG